MPPLRDMATAPLGAQVSAGGVTYRVWAPDHAAVAVCIDAGDGSRRLPLGAEAEGYWSVSDPAGRAGDRYRFQLGADGSFPDVASRFQPEGVDGRSECIDPGDFVWRCPGWRRPGWQGQTTYELHLGTFTPAGTCLAAIPRLEHLREVGVEAIELMPVADFAGDRSWGYDGVALYAPARCYGRPADLRALVDAAHGLGLAVILDVVYNHVGPQGGYHRRYAADYFRSDRDTPWGQAFNLDGPGSAPVRDFIKGNAAHWLDEFRFDGLRLDATHAIPDSSATHLLQEIADLAHRRGAFIVAEDDRNRAALLQPAAAGGFDFDALWADDFHHQIRVALTGIRTSYFAGYRGAPADLADTLAHGWTYRGQPYPAWDGRPRGSEAGGLAPQALIYCLENHDQVGNRARGERLEHLIGPAQFRAASMLLCLAPYAALLFMGQEWAASTPFLFFSDHRGELGARISEGRRREFGHEAGAGPAAAPADPEAMAAFVDSKLRWEERSEPAHAAVLSLYRECLRLRRTLTAAGAFDRGRWTAHASGDFLALRYRLRAGEGMLLLTLRAGRLASADVPLALAAGPGRAWRIVLDGEARRFGGRRDDPADGSWTLEGPGALWLEAAGPFDSPFDALRAGKEAGDAAA